MKSFIPRMNLSPIAKKENIVYWNDYRITVLFDRLFRVERSSDGIFLDGATQAVWYRDMPAVGFVVEKNKGYVRISTDATTLVIKEDFYDSYVVIDGRRRYFRSEKNLLGTYRTLDECDGGDCMHETSDIQAGEKIKLCKGVCGLDGFAVLDDENSLVVDEYLNVSQRHISPFDKYIFAYGNDHRGAVKAFFAIEGCPPMIPRYALGNWWSRYYPYSDSEYLILMNEFAENDVPLSVATIDMDWHYSFDVDRQKHITELGLNSEYYGGNGGWTGFSWNPELFPDHKDFLRQLHDMGLKVTLNLHPADGIRWWEDCYDNFAAAMGEDPSLKKAIPFDITNDDFSKNYFDVTLKPHIDDGVDFWWVDWQQGSKCKIDGLDPLWLLNHYHYYNTVAYGRERIILSRYCGAGAHRCPIGFSGDTHISWKTLKYLPYFTATAANIGYTWWSHDIGGHFKGECDYELYVRSVQFGVFSPINRLHSTCDRVVRKEPWFYPDGAGRIAADFLRLRYALIPYLYSAAYKTATEGTALIEPLYYGYPDNKYAYRFVNEYLFGEQMIVAPVTKKKKGLYATEKVYLPDGVWTDFFTGEEYGGGKVFAISRTLDTIPVFVKEGGIIPLADDRPANGCDLPVQLRFRIYKGYGAYTLYENCGDRKVFTKITTSASEYEQDVTVEIIGDEGVIPANRVITFEFVNVDGITARYSAESSVAITKKLKSDLTLSLRADGISKGIVLHVLYPQVCRLATLKKYCLNILTTIPGDNNVKQRIYNGISFCETKEKLSEYIDNCPNLTKQVKNRMKETF